VAGRLEDDLGGHETITATQRAVLEAVSVTKLMLDSVDRWLLEQHDGLVNRKRRYEWTTTFTKGSNSSGRPSRTPQLSHPTLLEGEGIFAAERGEPARTELRPQAKPPRFGAHRSATSNRLSAPYP